MFVANLEVFGFAVSGALYDAKSENVGLRDQRLALQCKLIFLWGIIIFGLAQDITRGQRQYCGFWRGSG